MELPVLSTEHVGRQAAENILHAFDYAKFVGRPLNTHVTINLRGLPDERMVPVVFRSIRRRFRSWLAYTMKSAGLENIDPAYVYVTEAPEAEHPHIHWVVHVPPFLAQVFERKLKQWVRKSRGCALQPYDVKLDQVDPHTDKSLAKYILKGTDKRYVGYLHLKKVAEAQGRVWGRRATASPAIGRTARKNAGFVPKRDRGKWLNSLAA